MSWTEKQLGQARENSTNAVTVYSPAASTTGIIKQIVVANVSSVDAEVSFFQDDNGTTYDDSTSLGKELLIPAKTVMDRNVYFPMNNLAGNFAYKSSVANALTITLWGAERV